MWHILCRSYRKDTSALIFFFNVPQLTILHYHWRWEYSYNLSLVMKSENCAYLWHPAGCYNLCKKITGLHSHTYYPSLFQNSMICISKYLKFYKSNSIFVVYLFYKGQMTKVLSRKIIMESSIREEVLKVIWPVLSIFIYKLLCWKFHNQFTLRPSYNTLGHIPKVCFILPQRHICSNMFILFYSW